MHRLRSLISVLSLVAACSSAPPTTAPPTGPGGGADRGGANQATDAPRLLGQPALEVPLDQAHPQARALWDAAQAMLGHRLRAPSRHATLTDHQQWTRDVLAPWIREHRQHLTAVESLARAVSEGDPRARLFAAVVFGTVLEDFVTQVRDVPAPETIARSQPLEQVFRDTLEGAIVPIRQATRDAYGRCVELARGAPELARWEAPCRERVAAFPVEPAPAPGDRPAAPAPWPAECEGDEVWVDPEAPEPVAGRPRELVVLVDPDHADERFDDAARERLRGVVAGRLRALVRLPQVRPAELARAERLRAARRWTEAGPVCGQPPPLLALLADRHPNMVVARVDGRCYEDVTPGGGGPERCQLDVYYTRAGSSDRAGLPDPLSVTVRGDPRRTESWLAAARALGRQDDSGGILGLIGRGEGGPTVLLRGISDDDPWLRVGPTLWALRAELAACQEVAGTAAYRLRWTISPAGEVASPEAELVGDTIAGGFSAARCLREALARTQWPCPRAGRPVAVDARVCIRR